ncbi:MAG TPA: C4-dicarboxylate ABC transporter [Firmicutes bacterium]|nr:C4-dicarboxylate ABC transporter [Bacillota bacterium]
MFLHAGLILLIMVISFAAAKYFKLTTELAMAAAALIGGIVHSKGIPVRHLVEGTFTYFDVCLIFITATFFMNIIKESGGIVFLIRKIITKFGQKRVICLLLLTFVTLIPGALTGAGAATVLTVGTLVGTVLTYMGVSSDRVTAIIFLCAAMGAAAPPINLWAMMAAAGSNMPYVGFFRPLLVLSVIGALLAMFILGYKGEPIQLQQALAELPKPHKKMNWVRVGLPFAVLLVLILLGRIWPFHMPILGLPLIFVLSSLTAYLLSPVKLNVIEIAENTVRGLTPLIGMMIVVGMLIQIMALSGARGLISLAIVTLPLGVLFATLFLILPISEGLLQYAVAPLIGVPLVFLFNMKGLNPIICLSAMSVMWPLGDCLPPTAVVGRATVMELGYSGHYYKGFVKSCLVPMALILFLSTLFMIYSNKLGFLVG